ncbi:mitochondrial intermediate peptidase, mitochondrial-like isoform X3 [Magnolia sinica]|uniref:mitochondrial intermediate peptidase, mitochondrial-like isoform X2 n=1 Tax=Magnolia sinica TaxID=86752 RepID=UPI0026599ED0|nr:mitochondrial intermediate peptidase, mitochondrial-like isoform X2 [Magnolia sinica]XP_058092282.1 mitochondrial intermediate peptidase, mitochondrial-like isoform X3 [Magnolia sinica]
MFFNGFILLHFNSVHNFVIACTMCSSLLPSILSACLCDQCIDLELISHSFGFSFSENIITDLGFVDIFPASRIPKHMQHLLKPIYRTMSGASKEPLGSRDMVKEKGFCVTTDPGTLSSILKWASDAEDHSIIQWEITSGPIAGRLKFMAIHNCPIENLGHFRSPNQANER